MKSVVPGGSMPFKAFVAGITLCAVLGYPIFGGGVGGKGKNGDGTSTKTKQGHDYFSQERPEAILQAEHASRQRYLQEREQRRREEGKETTATVATTTTNQPKS